MGRKVVAIVGSYRKGGTVDTAVQAILDGARARGAVTRTIYLTEQHIEFCTNCRRCTQALGLQRGQCVQRDDLESILEEVDSADAIVLGSPVNFFNVTAIFRRFMERLAGFSYWPWGKLGPETRDRKLRRKSVLVSSSAMPGLMLPVFTGAAKALRLTSKILGAKPVAKLWIGLAGQYPQKELSAKTLARARRIGMGLI